MPRCALAQLLQDWSAERHAELAEMLSSLAHRLLADERCKNVIPGAATPSLPPVVQSRSS